MNSQKIKLFNFSILYDIVKWFVVRYLDKFTGWNFLNAYNL